MFDIGQEYFCFILECTETMQLFISKAAEK